MNIDAKELIASFLIPPNGKSPEAIKARILHWVDVANHPERHVLDPSNAYAIAVKRRTARQNARKLIDRHPEVALQIKSERSQEAS